MNADLHRLNINLKFTVIAPVVGKGTENLCAIEKDDFRRSRPFGFRYREGRSQPLYSPAQYSLYIIGVVIHQSWGYAFAVQAPLNPSMESPLSPSSGNFGSSWDLF